MDNSPKRYLFLIGSARRNGNTEQLAKIAASTLPTSAIQEWVYLSEIQLETFKDIRHAPGEIYEMPTGKTFDLVQSTIAADELIFICPVYWYSFPAVTKLYLDHWSGWMRIDGLQFKEKMKSKKIKLITMISDEDESFAEPLLHSMKLISTYMDMEFSNYLIGHANRPGDIITDEVVLKSALNFFN